MVLRQATNKQNAHDSPLNSWEKSMYNLPHSAKFLHFRNIEPGFFVDAVISIQLLSPRPRPPSPAWKCMSLH